MDIYCSKCGEPWDIDCLHDSSEHNTFQAARKAFYRDGCAAIWGDKCTASDSLRTRAAGVLQELLGDDIDGLASEMEDYFG